MSTTAVGKAGFVSQPTATAAGCVDMYPHSNALTRSVCCGADWTCHRSEQYRTSTVSKCAIGCLLKETCSSAQVQSLRSWISNQRARTSTCFLEREAHATGGYVTSAHTPSLLRGLAPTSCKAYRTHICARIRLSISLHATRSESSFAR